MFKLVERAMDVLDFFGSLILAAIMRLVWRDDLHYYPDEDDE